MTCLFSAAGVWSCQLVAMHAELPMSLMSPTVCMCSSWWIWREAVPTPNSPVLSNAPWTANVINVTDNKY
jgi:hypothetical protein